MNALFDHSSAWKVSALSWEDFQQFSRTQPFQVNRPPPPTLAHWQVTLLGCLSGRVVLAGSPLHGQWIRTTPVHEVRIVGPNRQPMAITESGTDYLLGEMAAGFSLDDAEAWVLAMMRKTAPLEWHPVAMSAGARDSFGLHQPV
jgi:hypothetical protein